MNVIGFGALNLDRLHKVNKIAAENEETYIENITQDAGGSAANTIYALAKLGMSTGFIGAIGDDVEGEFLLNSLKETGVDLSGIGVRKGKKTGVVNVFIDPSGERAMYVYPGANSNIKMEDLSLEYLNKSELLHMTSFAEDEQLVVQKELLAKEGLSHDIKVSFAPGSLYVQKGLNAIIPIIEKSYIIFLNQDEVEILTARGYPEGAEFLHNKGCNIVVITLRESGCYIKSVEGSLHVDAIKSDVVDTTGAGDAFVAGFLYGLISDNLLEKCGLLGNALASKCITKVGARIGLPDKEEFERYLKHINL